MTYGKVQGFFPGIGAAALVAALAVGACSGTTIEDVPAAAGRSGGPVDTGTFPNLNVPQRAATAQFTNEERDAKLAQLRAKQQSQDIGGAPVESPEARRKRLQVSQDEQSETLKVIEGQ
ncbi:MAG TPA: hypothetical protein VIZ90_09905 [Rhizobiaceae bacterium]